MKFSLGAEVTVSAFTEVEADTLAEALRIAEGREVVIGGIHSGTDSSESWIIEDADGEATGIHQVEE